MIEDIQEKNEILINDDNNNNINNNNILSNLFKEYRKSKVKNFARLKSVSFSNIVADNFRKDFYDLGKENNNIDYAEMIKKKLEEIKISSTSQFQNCIDNINLKFEGFKDNIITFIESKERKMSMFENDLNNKDVILNYAKQNIFNKINNIFQICDNIINCIEKNFELLASFYTQSNLIDSQKQFDRFLINNTTLIQNCSIVSKFNFADLDINNIKKINYYKYYINYLSQLKIEDEEEIRHYTIIKEELPNGLGFITENFPLLDKLTLSGLVSNDLDKIFNTIGSIIQREPKSNLTQLNIKNFNTIDLNLETPEPLNMLKKIKIQNGAYIKIDKISLFFIRKNNNLKSLSLEDVNMTDIGFKALMLSFIENESITNTLEHLSLEGNKITMVRYDSAHSKFQDRYFQNLKWLNLSRNNIYKFEFFLKALPKLKFIDLTTNNIPTASFMDFAIKSKDKLVLFNDNIFITNSQKNNEIYINYLNEIMPKFDTEIKTLNLNFTYDIENQTNLAQLILSKNIIFSLIKLDLSFCGLRTDVLINFFKNNPKFISLKKLILQYNNLTSDFFREILNLNEICLDNLNFLDLSENDITCNKIEKMENFYNFIEKYKYLDSIRLINSNFLSNLLEKKKDNQYIEIFNKLFKHTTESKRNFKFIVNEANPSYFSKDDIFLYFFEFKI